jgi:hypothetical protein
MIELQDTIQIDSSNNMNEANFNPPPNDNESHYLHFTIDRDQINQENQTRNTLTSTYINSSIINNNIVNINNIQPSTILLSTNSPPTRTVPVHNPEKGDCHRHKTETSMRFLTQKHTWTTSTHYV